MLSENLFTKILLEPFLNNEATKLDIVSGYASPSMADKHLLELKNNNIEAKIHLTVGMSLKNAIDRPKHLGFCQVCKIYKNFVCDYLICSPSVHAKVYLFSNEKNPIAAYVGSANYTSNGFLPSQQQEVLAITDPQKAFKFIEKTRKRTAFCNAHELDQHFSIPEKIDYPAISNKELPSVTLPLYMTQKNREGKVHEKAGLNWGQRKGRNLDQAYIPVPIEERERNILPPLGVPFTILTDDDISMICVVAQEQGKAIHTTENNSIMGRYFRNRLGVEYGERVRVEDLERYGRKEVTIYKIDNETYYLDFSV